MIDNNQRFNILIVGEKGLKKKEIVKEIFSDFVVCKDELLFEWNQTNASNSALENKKGKFSIHIYETPDYGMGINNADVISTIKSNIESRIQAWRSLDGQLLTDNVRLSFDTRIHVVFYYISPFALKKIDIEFLNEIGHLVPIIPIVSRIDALSDPEKLIHLNNVSSVLCKRKIFNFELNEMIGNNNGDEEEMKEIRDCTDDSTSNQQHSKVRNVFGLCCNDKHESCDLEVLKSLLFQQGNIHKIKYVCQLKTIAFCKLQRKQNSIFAAIKRMTGIVLDWKMILPLAAIFMTMAMCFLARHSSTVFSNNSIGSTTGQFGEDDSSPGLFYYSNEHFGDKDCYNNTNNTEKIWDWLLQGFAGIFRSADVAALNIL